MTKSALLALITLVPLASAPSASSDTKSPEPRRVVFRTQTMGTWASLTLATTDSAGASDLAYRGLLVFHHVDSLMSNWTDNSEVARINREAGDHATLVHPEVAEVLGVARRVGEESAGAFDITVEPLVRLWGFLGGTPRVPSQSDIDRVLEQTGHDKLLFDEAARTIRFTRRDVRIDLGGIAKGYAVDRVAVVLRRAGARRALIDLSGNMIAMGDAPDHPGWRVGIRDPSGTLPYLATLTLHDQAIATSGDYEQFVDANGKRYGHILDPRTGWSARGLSSVTVVSERATFADAWATALFVLGPEAARRLARERADLSVVLIAPGADGKSVVWVEEALRGRFALLDAARKFATTRFF
jgi:thiamine biosynthesis lipoprotein